MSKTSFSELFNRVNFPKEINTSQFSLFNHKREIKIEGKKIGEKTKGWFSDNKMRVEISGEKFKIERKLFSGKTIAFDNQNRIYAQVELIKLDKYIQTPKITFAKESFAKPSPSKEMNVMFKAHESKLNFVNDKTLQPIEEAYSKTPFFSTRGKPAFDYENEKVIYDPKVITMKEAIIAKILLDFYYTNHTHIEVIPLDTYNCV